MNWSLLKKVFVTAEICLLTTSVYIGSAIYTAGNEGIMMQFGVSQTAVSTPQSLLYNHVAPKAYNQITGNPRPNPLRSRLRRRPHALGPHVRDPADRPHAHLHRHSRRIRRPSTGRHLRAEFRHAARLPFHNRLRRESRPSHRRRIDCRHVPSLQKSLRDRDMGHRRGVRARARAIGGRLCGAV